MLTQTNCLTYGVNSYIAITEKLWSSLTMSQKVISLFSDHADSYCCRKSKVHDDYDDPYQSGDKTDDVEYLSHPCLALTVVYVT